MAKDIRLISIERTQGVILCLLILGSLLFWDRRITMGVAMGGGIVVVNFMALRRIIEAGFSGEISKSFFVKFAIKFLALLAAVAGVALLLRGVINLIAFLAGLLTIFLAIVVEGLRGYRYTGEEQEKNDGT